MADRLKLLVQKRTSLKAQITGLTNALDKGKFEKAILRLRFARLTELYHAFEEYHDEIMILDANDTHHAEFVNIQERFYTLADKIENIANIIDPSDNNSPSTSNGNRIGGLSATEVVKTRRIKLPEAPLPMFDGRFESWLSFKGTFTNMIGSRTDLSEVDKLHYLKSALTGEAANKIQIFSVDGTNYSNAWELLERAYEVKRILISRHLSMMLNLPVLDKETTGGLMKLADDAQQHIASLNSLGVTVGPEMIVHIIEGKMPKSTLDKWEVTLEKDKFPEPNQLYEFLYKTAVSASRRERAKVTDGERNKFEPPTKKMRTGPLNRAFVVKTSRNCIACKAKQHPLYLCDKFKQLPVSERIKRVKDAKLCYNCMRSHRGTPCKFSSCLICQKRHNTLLHLEGGLTKSDTLNPEASSSK